MRGRGAALGALAVLALCGCETTQELSAKIGRRLGHQRAAPGTTSTGARNRAVRVDATALIPGNPAAVAVRLTNSSATAQTAIPVSLDVLDAKGASVYRNDVKGIEPSLQSLALLPPHASAWFVDDQVLSSGPAPSAVRVEVGAATAPPRTAAAVTTSRVRASTGFPGPHVNATLRNGSSKALRNVTVYAVTVKGGRPVGAGRALVASLAASGSATVTIPIVGSVSATIALTIVP
jgi:hypothetical protein